MIPFLIGCLFLLFNVIDSRSSMMMVKPADTHSYLGLTNHKAQKECPVFSGMAYFH